jgi:hypothetical protein
MSRILIAVPLYRRVLNVNEKNQLDSQKKQMPDGQSGILLNLASSAQTKKSR